MKKLVVSSVVLGIVGISTLVAGCGQTVSTSQPAAAAALEPAPASVSASANQETIVTGSDGQKVIQNSFDGSMVNLDGSPYQPMPVAEGIAAVPSFPIGQRSYGAEPMDWDVDGNPIYSREQTLIIPPGRYSILPVGQPAPEGSVTTPGGRVLVPLDYAQDGGAPQAVGATGEMTHDELVAFLKTLNDRMQVLQSEAMTGSSSPDQIAFELQATDDAIQIILARIAGHTK